MNSTNPLKIPVLIAGALGKMGSEVVRMVIDSPSCELIGAIDTNKQDEAKDIGLVLGLRETGVLLSSDLEASLCSASQSVRDSDPPNRAVLVDFTHPKTVYKNVRTSIAYGVHPVIGTTGLNSNQLEELKLFSEKASIGSVVIPNFSIGMVLLQQAAAAASNFYDYAELTESHHNQKADAPSGTCIKTAELMEELGKTFNHSEFTEQESLIGSRGGLRESGLRLHSVRLPGIVAQQQVIFGSPGETYTLTHNTIDRAAYMPGVLHAIKRVRHLNTLLYGLEKIL